MRFSLKNPHKNKQSAAATATTADHEEEQEGAIITGIKPSKQVKNKDKAKSKSNRRSWFKKPSSSPSSSPSSKSKRDNPHSDASVTSFITALEEEQAPANINSTATEQEHRQEVEHQREEPHIVVQLPEEFATALLPAIPPTPTKKEDDEATATLAAEQCSTPKEDITLSRSRSSSNSPAKSPRKGHIIDVDEVPKHSLSQDILDGIVAYRKDHPLEDNDDNNNNKSTTTAATERSSSTQKHKIKYFLGATTTAAVAALAFYAIRPRMTRS